MSNKSYSKVEIPGWTYFSELDAQLDPEKGGKWMYFFADYDQTLQLCEQAVANQILEQCKLTSREALVQKGSGVACFYLNIDNIEGHKKVIDYFKRNNMIQKKKNGNYYNISFKLDNQTKNKEYAEDYQAVLKLEELMDLKTGEWFV